MKRHSGRNGDAGSALIEAAMTIPILLLITVGIFEVGRAYETWQVLSNAAREGARIAILPNTTSATVTAMVRTYMANGALSKSATAPVTVNQAASLTVNGVIVPASQVTINYPFDFIMLQPVARLVVPSATVGQSITMQATSLMRNEQ